MLRGVDPGEVRAAAERELRVLANRRHLAAILGDASLLEPWRGPVAEPGPRELVAVALEEWAAEPLEVPLETWAAAARPSRGRRHRRRLVDVDEGDDAQPPGCRAPGDG